MESQEILEVRNAVRKFCEREVIPQQKAMDNNPTLCRELMQKLGETGFLAPTIPEEYSGMGASLQIGTVISEEIVRGNPSLALSVGAHSILSANTILQFGSEDQKRKYLPKMARGELIGAWGVTEPAAGSDVQGMQATAKKQGDGFVLKGNKTFITNAPIADVVVAFAKTDPKSISGFVLEKKTVGLTLGKAIEKFGMEGSPTGDVFMENVSVGKDALIGKEGEGFKQIAAIFNYERIWGATLATGTIKHCLNTALKYASTRKAFGQAILDYQAIQLKISQMYAHLTATEAMMKELCSYPMTEPDFHMKIAASKILYSKWAVDACSETMQILGGLGYTTESDIGRFLRDVKLMEIGGGTTDIQHLIVARGLIKQM
jgi:isovaleryl-CoA dehydrogenase